MLLSVLIGTAQDKLSRIKWPAEVSHIHFWTRTFWKENLPIHGARSFICTNTSSLKAFKVNYTTEYKNKRIYTQLFIISSWLVSTALWTPGILGWQYYIGNRTVPDSECYVQDSSHHFSTVTSILVTGVGDHILLVTRHVVNIKMSGSSVQASGKCRPLQTLITVLLNSFTNKRWRQFRVPAHYCMMEHY